MKMIPRSLYNVPIGDGVSIYTVKIKIVLYNYIIYKNVPYKNIVYKKKEFESFSQNIGLTKKASFKIANTLLISMILKSFKLFSKTSIL